MQVKKPSPKQLKELVSLYMKYKNISPGKDEKSIISNLRKHLKNDLLMVAVESKEVISGVAAANTMSTDSHKIWELKHFILKKDCYNRGFAESLIKILENKIRSQSETCKIFHIIPDNEEDLALFKRMHFKKEGELPNFFFYNQKAHVLGKTFKKTE